MTALTIHETDGPFQADLTPGRWIVFVTDPRQHLTAISHQDGQPDEEWEPFKLATTADGLIDQISAVNAPGVDRIQVSVDRGSCTAIVYDEGEMVDVVVFKRWRR